jgi:hypothetical protein
MALSAIFDAGGRMFTLARRVEELVTLQAKVDATVEAMELRLRAIEDRLLRAENTGPNLITEARSAASAAATAMSGAALNDVVTRLTRVEIRLEGLDTTPGSTLRDGPKLPRPKRGRRKVADGTGGDQ